MMFHGHAGHCRILIAGCLWLVSLAGTLRAGQTPRQEKSEFFRLIDFDNASLLSHTTELQGIRTQVTHAATLLSDEEALAVYASAMSNLWACLPAHNYSCGPSRVLADSAVFTTNFFSWIDLEHPGLESVKASVLATNYPAALEAWRDYTVDKFRQAAGLQVYQHSNKASLSQQNLASLLLGQKTYGQYLDDGTNTCGGIDFYEIYGMSGEPGTLAPISWTNQPPTSDTSLDTKYSYDQFFFASPLIYRYWSGDVLGSGTNITLTCVGTSVTVRFATPHGLADGDYVTVYNASPSEYNGLFRVTVAGPTNATYTAVSAPSSSPASGTSRTVSHVRQPRAVQKWFEILGDYATRQKNMVSALQLVENTALRSVYRTVYDDCDWGVHAGAVLGQGDRLRELIAALTLFCKLLPEAEPVQRSWNTEVHASLDTPLAPGARQVIPAEALARVALSVMADTTEAVMLAYFRVGMVPNQRLNGLTSLYLTARYFDEFRAAPELLRQTDAALADFAHTMFYPDGPMLERSPNYNEGDADKIRMLNSLSGTNATPGILELAERLRTYERGIAFMQTPLGGLPRMASYCPPNPPALWQGGPTASWRSSIRASFADASDTTATNLYLGLLDSGLPVPPGTSVAFPYAGYYVMRNGWGSRAHFLYFASTPPGNGHCQMDHNGIQVCAFGRNLLSTAGAPPYDPTFVDASQFGDFSGFARYQGESSSFKVNTVAVDGRSQNESGIKNATVTAATLPGLWVTSPEFDYAEGVYSNGYGRSNSGYWLSLVYDAFTNASIVVNSVAHTRSVFFLRTPGLWVVTDTLAATDAVSHDYRQVWNFPAYSSTFGPTVGFMTNEVFADDAAHLIRTSDADGPNVTLYHLGPQAVTYETYIGSRSPYLGWAGNGIGGLRLPAVNVHAIWQGAGTQKVVTVIAPSDTGEASPVIAIRTNTSSQTAVNLELDLSNGHTLRIVQGLQPQTISVGGQNLSSITVLSDISPDGLQNGLALDASGFTASDFCFSASTTNLVVLSAVGRPTNFTWTANGDWQLPSTADPQNTPPAIPPISDQRIPLNAVWVSIPFFVGDKESAATNLAVTAHALNQALLSDAAIVLAGSGTNRTVTVTPTPGLCGTTSVELTVTDPQGLSSVTRFTLNVFATFYWDVSSASGLQSGGGVWGGSAMNWSSDSAGTDPRSVWLNSGNSAVFAGTDGNYTVTVTDTQTVNDLVFSCSGYTVTGGTLFHPNGAMSICADADATIDATVLAVTNIIKTGRSRLTLGAVNRFTGDTFLTSGALQLAADNALPSSSGLIMGSGATAGRLVLSGANQTVRWLEFASTTNSVTNRIEIATGRTLAVAGDLLVGGLSSNITTLVDVVGTNATLAVTNCGSVIQIGRSVSSVNGNRATLNLSSLGTFVADLGSNGILRVGDNSGNSSGGQATLLLAATNAMTVGTLAVGDGGRGVQNILKMGQGNTSVCADTVNLGTGVRDSAAVTFASSAGSLLFRACDGAGRAVLNIGTGGSTSGSSASNLLDLRGHVADLLLDTLTMGEQMRVGSGTHTLHFDSGFLDVSAIRLARTKASGASTSAINVGGGDVSVGTGGILLASNAVGNLTITGGDVTVRGDILKGAGGTGSAHLTLNGSDATLDLCGHAVGHVGAWVNANFIAGTLRNLGEFNGGADVVKASDAILVFDGTNTYSGTTVISNGVLRLGAPTSLPVGSAVRVAGGVYDLGGYNVTNGSITSSSGRIANGRLFSSLFVKEGSGTLSLDASLASSAPVVIRGGVLRLSHVEPGLYEGAVSGVFNTTSSNPRTSVQLTTRFANTTTGWPSNTTYIYSGYIWNRDATNVNWTFAENFDDNVLLKIDDSTLIANGVNWNTPTLRTATLNPGAHTFEARFGQGGGGAGPVDSQWWITGKKLGFGYDPMGRNETNSANYVAVTDSGDGSLLTVSSVGMGGQSTNLFDAGTSIELATGAVLDLGGLNQTLASLSGVGFVSNGTLAVTGTLAPGGTNAIGVLSVAAAASFTGALLTDVDLNGSSDLLSVSGDVNLSDLALAVANPEQLNRRKVYTFASVTGILTGRFCSTNLPDSRWHVVAGSDGTLKLIFANGARVLLL